MNIDFYPILPRSTYILHKNDKYIFIIPEKPDWVVANKNFASILLKLDGKTSIKDILNTYKNHNYINDLEKTLKKLVEENFFYDVQQKCINSKNKLYTLHLNMTSKCNLKCVYCYAEERDNNINDDIDIECYKKMLDEVYEINKNTIVTFTGGEPLLNDKTLLLAQYCKDKGLGTMLLTNGTLIDENNAYEIAKNFDSIRVSIEGATEKTHDKIRGKSSYLKAIKGINLLKKYNNNPLIATTVNNINKHEMADMVKKYGNNLHFQPIYSVGRAKNTKLEIDGEEYYNILNSIDGVKPHAFLQKHIANMKNRGCLKCAIGEGEISIASNGDVYPCHMLHTKDFYSGNIKKQSFSEIYNNSKVLINIRNMSVNNRQTCKLCPVRLLCAGGCWARAYYESGDLNGFDSFCDYELLSYKNALLNLSKSN